MGTFSAGPNHDTRQDASSFDRGFRKVPSLVQWMVTGNCSGTCRHCMTANGRSMATMSRAAVQSFLDDVAAMGVDELLITGGEPLERDDLGELVLAMQDRRIRWSLNTARRPDPELQRIMRAWPPCFVAVSLDGPSDVHDRIRGWPGAHRESLDAIRLFAELTDGNVAAGTTVSQHNYASLADTFSVVIASGASTWGLHLVVPEGRAATQSGMMLSPAQLRGLIRFAADKRKYFPVTMADELGYCGSWEPLVRDTPFFCGAGRTQCVVLPNGDVVPCTTFDPRERGGNVTERSLADIWQSAFEHLRRADPIAACQDCGHAKACGGGCWLQRRHGVHCHRAVWDRPPALSTAAGIAVCLGLAGCSRAPTSPDAGVASQPVVVVSAAVASTPDAQPSAQPTPTTSQPRPVPELGPMTPGMTAMDAIILRWYAAQQRGVAMDPRILDALGPDPARPFVDRVLKGEAAPPWPERVEQLRAATGSSYRSLHLVSLMWRDIASWCFDGPPSDRRSEPDRRLLREVMLALTSTTKSWRAEIFANKLHPFFHRDDPANRRWFMSKAGPPPELRAAMRSVTKHWDAPEQAAQITQAYLAQHPFAASMRLAIRIPKGASIEVVGQTATLRGAAHVGVFDVLRVSASGPVTLHIVHRQGTLPVRVSAGVELTHPDLLRLAYEQNVTTLDADMEQGASMQTEPLLLPALRAKYERLSASGGPADELQRVQMRLTDAWLF